MEDLHQLSKTKKRRWNLKKKYLLRVPGDPRVQEQLQPGLVELLGSLHRDEDVIHADVLSRRGVPWCRRCAGGTRRLRHLPPGSGQCAEIRRKAFLLAPSPRLLLGARAGDVLLAHLLGHLSARMLQDEREQQQAEPQRAGCGHSRLLAVILQHVWGFESILRVKRRHKLPIQSPYGVLSRNRTGGESYSPLGTMTNTPTEEKQRYL